MMRYSARKPSPAPTVLAKAVADLQRRLLSLEVSSGAPSELETPPRTGSTGPGTDPCALWGLWMDVLLSASPYGAVLTNTLATRLSRFTFHVSRFTLHPSSPAIDPGQCSASE